MTVRELVVLGSASQVPTRHRNHNGYLLRWEREGFLFDPGEGTQRQMTIAGVSVHDVTHVCVTHFHGDHCLGLPGVLQRCSMEGVPHPVTVHYPATGEQYFERLRHASIFDDRAEIVRAPIASAGMLAAGDDWTLRCTRLDHRVESWGYRVDTPPTRGFAQERLDALGLAGPIVGTLRREGSVRVGGRVVTVDEVSEERPGISCAFVMDTRLCDGARELAADVDLLVCESTFLDRDTDLADAYGHLTARQAAELARDAGARSLVLTHFSQRYAADGHEFLEEAGPVFAGAIVAYDGFRVPVTRRP